MPTIGAKLMECFFFACSVYSLHLHMLCVLCMCVLVCVSRSLAHFLSIHPSIYLHTQFFSHRFILPLSYFLLSLSRSLCLIHTHRPYIPGITVNAKLLRGTVVRIPPRQGDVLRAVPPPQLFNPDLTLYAQVFFKKLRSPPLLLGIVPFSLPCSLELRASHLSITHTNTKTEAEGR